LWPVSRQKLCSLVYCRTPLMRDGLLN
jgi:hypothetical protein